MNGLDGFTVFACAFLLTYLTHSTVAVLGARLLIARLKALTSPELRVLVWKLALTLPLASASAVTVLELPHFGIRLPIILTPATDAPAFAEQSSGLAAGALPASSLAPAGVSSALDQTQREAVDGLDSAIEATSLLTLLRNRFDARTMISCVVGLWSIACLIGLATLTIQLDKVRRLRVHATVIVQPELLTALDMLRRRLGIRKHVTLLQPTVPAGPLTAGFFRPFILLPKGWCGQDRAQRNAILGHELAHIARRDAFWHLAVQAICRFLPFQPLNWGLAKQLRTEMDFVADSLAARTASERTGLARCLMTFGSVDENPLSATALADNGLQQTPNSGCSPGCRNARLCESVTVIDRQQLDAQLLVIFDAWPRLSLPIRTALITMIEAAVST